MKQSEIQVGVIYVNRGAGRTRRTVVAIGEEHQPPWDGTRGDEPGVLYEQNGVRRVLYLSSFAKWAKGSVG